MIRRQLKILNNKIMKTRLTRMLTVLLGIVLGCGCWGDSEVSAAVKEYKKQKTFERTFEVSASDLLLVNNRYGNVTVAHWNEPKVEIKVVVESRARKESDAQELLDRVQVKLEKAGNQVSGVTDLLPQKGNGRNSSFEINYFIRMPEAFRSDISLKYGNILLPAGKNGSTRISLKYGNLDGGDFVGDLDLEAKYGNVTLGNLRKVMMELGYVGKMKSGNVEEMSGDVKYSDLGAGSVRQASLEMKYSNLSLEEIDRLELDLDYGNADIGCLKNWLKVDDLGYSNMDIERVAADFERIEVESHYGNLNIGVPSQASVKVRADDMRYSSFDVNGLKLTKEQRMDHDYDYEINGGRGGEILYNGGGYGNLTIKRRDK